MRTMTDIAAPSFVMAGTVADNAAFLAGKVGEVGLCFFEGASCLAYGEADMPPALARLPLRWHVHLPVDLPWGQGGAAAARMARAVYDKAAYLAPHCAVLHPPVDFSLEEQGALLREFALVWGNACPLALENIEHGDFSLLAPDAVCDFCFCLDVGHLLAFGQERILKQKTLMERVRLVHWSAPGDGDRHLPLTALTPSQHARARAVGALLPQGVRHLIEVFRWAGVVESFPVLAQILEG